ncbi:DUF2975 domain-containing protein [Pedobacter sp. MC2016-14]|uniref:DUF2975 domain-containing protein n=1 Tax=Pedobacter sp. MC2016-14 TaxID=2897327 RepID=UPI001E304067|nr:DUF2975 domain-containing protein [Pedobacter sp. MC2016-14]MCD0488365.1 DUF2975 domain-containing protein [Pedobacter sp. MC2016-14]
MKLKLTTSAIINLIIGTGIALSILFIVSILWFSSTTMTDWDSTGSSAEMKTLSPIDPVIPDTIPHRQYVKLKDSIKHARQFKNGVSASSTRSELIGFQSIQRCDGCNPWDNKERKRKKDYLLSLSGWKLDTARGEFYTPVTYFVKNDQPYIRKTFCKPRKLSKTSFICYEKDIAVPFRVDSENKDIMIPISENFYEIAMPSFMGLSILFFIYFIYFVIGAFVQFLAEIAKGTPFSERNVKRLRFILLNLFFIPLGIFLINLLIIPLIFQSYFTPEVMLDNESWKSLGKPAILCLIFAALYIAFKKGKQLKEESDLTV